MVESPESLGYSMSMYFLEKLTPTFLKTKGVHLYPTEQRLLWLVRLRFVALFSQLPLTIIGRYYGYLNQSSHIIFTMFLIALLSYNAHLYRNLILEKKKNTSELYLTLQITFDLIAFASLLSISGSSNNPFYAFFYVMAILGGIFSSGKSSYIFAAALLFSVTMIQIQPAVFSDSAYDNIFSAQTFPYLLSQLFIPTVAFLIARSFGELFNEGQQRLLAMTVHSERLDRLRALGSLSAGFSHEFASPLQNAKLRLNRFTASSTPNKLDLEECKASIQDCENVLRRMNFAQLSFADQDFEVADIKILTEEAIQSWQDSSPNFRISLHSLSANIRVNKINFVQTFFNILDNAAEVSSPSDEIIIRITKSDSTIKISIQDKGTGFSKDVLDRLGEPFNTTKEKGTGLGLYSTQLFMNSVGGNLYIKNGLSSGATVELCFPYTEQG